MAMYPASRLGSERHTLSVLVENRPGVLARIAGLFARRAFNINSLSVSPTERPDISRVTVTADVEAVPLEQISYSGGEMHFLGVRVLEGGVAVSVLDQSLRA